MKFYKPLLVIVIFSLVLASVSPSLASPARQTEPDAEGILGADALLSPQAVDAYPILVCPATGTGGDNADLRGIRFTVSQDFSAIELRMAGNTAGEYSFTAELRNSTGFTDNPIATVNVSANLPASSSGAPFLPVTIPLGLIPVSGSQTYTLKLIPAVGLPFLFFEVYGIGNAPCPNVEETEENDVANPTVRGDPAGFKVLAPSPASYAITSTFAATPPNIDGVISIGEWDLSNRIWFENGFLTVRNDGFRLYVLLNVLYDTVEDTGRAPDYFWLTFDVNHDGLITPDVDKNYGINPQTGNMRYQYYLGPNQWTGLQPTTLSSKASGFGCFWPDGTLTLISFFPLRINCLKHRVWEFGIDLSEIGGVPGSNVQMGFRAASPTPSFINNVPTNFSSDFSNLIAVSLASVLLPLPNPNATIQFDAKPIEVTQAIQDRDNTLPLVQDKSTAARVYVDVNNSFTSQPVVSYLYGSVGGVDLPGSPLAVLYSAPTSIDRSKLNNTANFSLPKTWDEGAVSFQAKARTLLGAEITSSSLSLSFNQRTVPTYWYIPINTGTNASPVLISNTEMASQRSYLEAVFPISRVNWVFKPWTVIGPTTVANTISALNNYYTSAVLAWILSVLFTGKAPFTLPDQIYGFTPSGGGISDPTWIGANGRVARGFRGTSREGTMAHEVNHNLDRSATGTWGRHVSGCGAAGPDPSWPYANDDIQEVGFDTRLPWVNTAAQVSVVPSNFPDYMSYCQSGKLPTKWISPYRWTNLYNSFGIPVNEIMLEQAFQIEDMFYVSGQVNDDGTGNLNPAFIQPGIASPSMEPFNASVEILDEGGSPLAGVFFNVDFLEDPEEPFMETYFNLQVPYVEGAKKIVLSYEGSVLDEIDISDNAPTVTVLSPNGGETWSGGTETISWSASDLDGDPLSFTILYTPDNGISWFPVATDVSGSSYDVDVSTLPAGAEARIRVIVTDGANTGEDDSDDTFTVTGQGPAVAILMPTSGSQIPVGALLNLVGEANDLEDAVIPDENFIWTEDDVVLGIGREISALLSPGLHEITLSVSDSDDNTSQAVVQVFVGYRQFLSLLSK